MLRSKPRLWTSGPRHRAIFPLQSPTNHQSPPTPQLSRDTFRPHSLLWDPSTRAPQSRRMHRHRKTTSLHIHPRLSHIMQAPPAMLHQIIRHLHLIPPHWLLRPTTTFLRILPRWPLTRECPQLTLLPQRNTCPRLTLRCLHPMNHRQRITCHQIRTI